MPLVTTEMRYQVRVFDANDDVIGVYDDLVNVTYKRELMAVTVALLTVPEDHPLVDQLSKDTLVGIYLSAPVLPESGASSFFFGIEWHEDFLGLYREKQVGTDEWGNEYYVLTVPHITEVLTREIVAWPRGVNERTSWVGQHTAAISQQIMQYNCGVDATVVNGRIRDADVVRDFRTAGLVAFGPVIDYTTDFESVLSAVRELQASGGYEFEVIRDARPGVVGLEYDVVDRIGTDKSDDIYLDLNLGTVVSAALDEDSLREKTVVIVGGGGVESSRTFDVTQGDNYAADNSYEVWVDARQQTSGVLPVLGAAAAWEYQARAVFDLDSAQTRRFHYARDYELGDTISGVVSGTVAAKRIWGVEVSFEVGRRGRVRLDLRDP